MDTALCPNISEHRPNKICINDNCNLSNPYICPECEELHEHEGVILAVRLTKLEEIHGILSTK